MRIRAVRRSRRVRVVGVRIPAVRRSRARAASPALAASTAAPTAASAIRAPLLLFPRSSAAAPLLVSVAGHGLPLVLPVRCDGKLLLWLWKLLLNAGAGVGASTDSFLGETEAESAFRRLLALKKLLRRLLLRQQTLLEDVPLELL